VLNPGKVGVAHGRHSIFPALILTEPLATPFFHVEWGISQDKICLKVRKAVVMESISLFDFAIDATDGQVHFSQTPGGVI